MKTKVLSLCIALLAGMSVWADNVWNCNVHEDCSKNGQTIYTRSTGQENGSTWVNLGLSVMWATCNVGATTPEEYGDYYAWGEVLKKTDVSLTPRENYKYADAELEQMEWVYKLTKYCNFSSYGKNHFTDNKTTLEPDDDAAHVHWGGNWRMPTSAEWEELEENCTWTWTKQNGIDGKLVTSKVNGNSIFLPATGGHFPRGFCDAGTEGYYWSSSLYCNDPNNAWYGHFAWRMINKNTIHVLYLSRANAISVRPVCPLSTNISTNALTLTLYADGCEKANIIRCETGQQVNVSAIPSWEQRHFVRWTDGNTDNPRLVKVTKDMTLTAEFALNQYTITASGEHGTVEGIGTYDYNTKVYLTAVPDKGYHFVKWSDDNTDNPFRAVWVVKDTTFTAVFAPNQYTITASGEHGTVEGTGTYDYNTKVYLTAVPDKGYHFVKWSNGKTYNPYYVYVRSDTTLTAEFAINQYTIATYAQHGNVSGGGTYDYGTTATLTATADKHYHFTQWSDGNTDNPRTVAVEDNATYTAEFKPDSYTITVSAGEHGNVNGGGTYDYGTTATLTATADAHYHFTQWTDGNTDNPRTVSVVGDVTYTAEFKPNSYTITVSAGEHGNVSGAGTYDYGTTATLTAIADEHYHFTQWSDGNTDNPRTVSVEGDATYTAEFLLNEYTITVLYDNTKGYVSGGGTYVYGTQVRLEVSANSGYEFAQWSNGATYNPYLLTATADLTLEAQFIPATAVDNVSADGTTPQKIVRDGQVYILRNGKTYTTTGVEVK